MMTNSMSKCVCIDYTSAAIRLGFASAVDFLALDKVPRYLT